MSKNTDYSDWSKSDLIKEVKKLCVHKKYGLVWDEEKTKEIFERETEGKLPVLNEIVRKTIEDESPSAINNVLIEGDNYHALSVLNYTHEKKIDVIYIDPPYNTGAKTWKYNNDYVEKDDAWRHSKWLTFMGKRLKLAKKLLTNDGFLICAIDANELFSLGLLLDKIYGESNRVGLVTVIHNPKGRNLSKFFSENSEFMLIYAKNISSAIFNEVVIDEEKQATFSMQDNEGKYRLEPFMRVRTTWSKKNKPKNYYPIYVSKDLKKITLEKEENYYEIFPKTKTGKEYAWKNIPDTFSQLNKNSYFTAIKENGEIKIHHKFREKQVFKNVWINKKYHSEFNGTNLLKKILRKNIFEYPKSLYLVKDILKIIAKKNSIVLDFFAGSGTTGQAVLQLNKEDGGNRKFILCTNNENNICTNVCYPRLEKIIKGYKDTKDEKIEGLGGNLKYLKTAFVDSEPTDQNKKNIVSPSIEMLCLKEDCFELVKSGKQFKIFKNLDDSYMGVVYYYDGIIPFKKEVLKLKVKINTYVFSLVDEVDPEDFADVHPWVTLKPIPSAILNVYRRIYVNVRFKKLSGKTHN